MDDESRKTILNRDAFWVLLAVVITFWGCIFLVRATLDTETMLGTMQRLDEIRTVLTRLDLHLMAVPDIPTPTPVPTPTPLTTIVPGIVFPTPTP